MLCYLRHALLLVPYTSLLGECEMLAEDAEHERKGTNLILKWSTFPFV